MKDERLKEARKQINIVLGDKTRTEIESVVLELKADLKHLSDEEIESSLDEIIEVE